MRIPFVAMACLTGLTGCAAADHTTLPTVLLLVAFFVGRRRLAYR